jgi:HSP20 family protein
MASRKFDPLEVFLQLESDLRMSGGSAVRAIQFRPSVDMYETEASLIVKMELPGVKPERVSIELSADDLRLAVFGDRREPPEEHEGRIRCYQLEIYFGSFVREIVLPPEMRFDRDRITASYRDGFLVISLPKRAEKRRIEINKDRLPDPA